MRSLRFAVLIAAGVAAAASAFAEGGAKHAEPPEGGWPFEGPFGEFDMASVQRGYQVYREVCAACHSMDLLSYRNLGEPGGPYYDPDYPNANDNPQVKALAADVEVLSDTPNDFGEFEYRPARPSDTFRAPFANDAAAKAANGGALPPDLSVITKARHGGASYIYSLIKGYPDFDEFVDGDKLVFEGEEDHGEHGPEGVLTQPIGVYYNPYYEGDTTPQWEGDPRNPPKGGFLAMGPQLLPGRVQYQDGTEATVDQMAYDIAQFLAWAGAPKMEQRKSLGLGAIIYLVILAGLLWFSFHRIWRDVDH